MNISGTIGFEICDWVNEEWMVMGGHWTWILSSNVCGGWLDIFHMLIPK